MFSRLHNRLGTAGLVVAVVALVAALAGTAFAATKLNGTQKKEVEKIAKKFAGKNGTNGAPGANGKDGTNGAAGTPGTPGAAGKSVVLTAEPPGLNCEEGGTKVEVEGSAASKKYVCNGEEGEEGPEGSPWTAGGTLPSGKTETGVWTVGYTEEAHLPSSALLVPLSFNVPLATNLEAVGCEPAPANPVPATCHVHFINDEGKEVIEPETDERTSTVCTGNAENPTAPIGQLCVYAGFQEKFFSWNGEITRPGGGVGGAGKTGAVVGIGFSEAGAQGYGTWAVTAP